jgi:hypothetical protein
MTAVRLVLLSLTLWIGFLHAQAPDDEFVGPFSSWSNLQRDYGTRRNSLQRALTELGTPGHSSNLFLPAGTYCTPPLTLVSRIGISIVGEDPGRTVIKYCGPRGGALLYLNGVAYSRFGRITFDCAGLASLAIDQSWDGHRNHFDTGNEYADVIFRNCSTAIRGGNLGYGFAETSVLRAHFGPSTGPCVILKNFNALDLWIWYSLFDQCFIGVTNDPGAGNFHVYNSVFRRSARADMRIHNTGIFNIRNNTSIGSRAFWVTSARFPNPALTTLQGNTLIDASSPAIVIGNQGPTLLIDNRIQSLPQRKGPVVSANELGETDLITVGNVFTRDSAVASTGRHISLDNRSVNTLSLREPALPGTPPNLHRRVFEVPNGASAAEIQRAINAATPEAGRRPVVHIPEGTYNIDTTITLPRDSDVQVVGDGYFATRLEWHGTSGGCVFRVLGPSKVTVRELAVNGLGAADGFEVKGIDQPGSRVYMQQAQLRESRVANLLVDALDYTDVDLRNVGHASSQTGISIKVIGGKLAAAGDSGGAKVNLFSGASSNNALSYELTRNGRLLVRDTWYETGSPTGFLRLSGEGTFTLHGSRVALPARRGPPAGDLSNFHGMASFLAAQFDDRIVSSGDARASRILALGLLGGVDVAEYLQNHGSPAAEAVLLNGRKASRGGSSSRVQNEGAVDPHFLRQMLSQTRQEQPPVIGESSAGISDVRFYRVSVGNAVIGIHLLP